MLAISAEGLEKTYRIGFFRQQTVKALRGLNLNIDAGQVYGLIGPNGAGKSTTLKILLNLVRASAGSARIFGVDIVDRAARQGLGFVAENPAPYEYLSGREFVTFSAKLCGVPSSELTRRVGETLERVGLERAADLRIRRYSKGMTQRVVLASALVGRPRLMVLDEPTSGLDPIGRRLVRDLIFEERKRGTTIVFCTHIISDVEAVCDRLSVLVAGQCVKEGTVTELLSGQAPRLELMVEGVSTEQIPRWNGTLVSTSSARHIVHLSEADLNPFVLAALGAGGRVLRINPIRFSLEDIFLEALKASGTKTVGAVIE